MGMKGRLYTTGDMADRLGVSRQRAYHVSRRKGFPEPFDEWDNGLAVWLIEDFEAWLASSRYAADPDEP